MQNNFSGVVGVNLYNIYKNLFFSFETPRSDGIAGGIVVRPYYYYIRGQQRQQSCTHNLTEILIKTTE